MDNDELAIRAVVNHYFRGTYEGNGELLRQAFYPEVRIIGNIEGKIVDWNLTEFIARVTAPPTAASKKEKYDKQIVMLDKTGDVAMVKARVAVGPFLFTDYITLIKTDGRWWIRFKSFTT